MGGRSARVALRTQPQPIVNPCPPGQIGGQYRPLSDSQLQAIVDSAFEILATIGMGEVPPKLFDAALKNGGVRSAENRLLFPRSMMEDIIAGACKSFWFHGRNGNEGFEVGGDRVYFGTGGAAVQTLDLDQGHYRPSTLKDLCDFTRLVDTLDNISWFTRCCIATDIADPVQLDLNTAFALARGTNKPVGTSFSIAESVDPIIDMFDAILDGEDEFRHRPFCKADISPVISPLRFGEDAWEVACACVRRGVPINAIIAAQSGATAPAPLAGMLAQTTAETLAGLAMVNLIEPGYPMIFSNWPFVVDLRTGSFSGGGGEISLLNAAAAQISNHLGLPSGVASSMSDAKAIDAQMGSEKAMSALAAGLSGANMVYESAGMSASLLGVSFEAFVIDNEMLAHLQRMVRGIEVNDETLGFETIRSAVFNEGHFLAKQQTLDAMERDYFHPSLADRNDPDTWAENGQTDIWSTARSKAKDVLRNHHPNYMDRNTEEKIRQNFSIQVD